MTDDSTKPCPSCGGEGTYLVEMKGGFGGSPRERTFRCRRCRGTGDAFCDRCETHPAVAYVGDEVVCQHCMGEPGEDDE